MIWPLPCTLVLLALALPSPAARAQERRPGGPLTWERVGDRPIDAQALAFDGAGALYAVRAGYAYHLDLSGGFPGVWELRSEEADDDALLGLGPDTLVVTGGHTERSTDGGFTWVEVYEDGGDPFSLHEAAPDTPLAGTLFLGSSLVAVSTDRGATWEERGETGANADVFAVLPSGRLVTGGHWGAAYSDDAGWTWQTSSLWGFGRVLCDLITRVEAPGGGTRVLVRCQDQTLPHVRVWYSDDEGETWLPEEGVPLPQPDDGVGRSFPAGLWTLGGSRALAVLGRGSVYLTEDGGETWSALEGVPDVSDDTYVKTSTLAPDGRLYVGLVGLGTLNAWVYRTEQRVVVPVASEPMPVSPDGLGLRARPNPSEDAVTASLHLGEPAHVEAVLYDALGRRVAVVHSGALGTGEHALALDTAGLPSGVYVVHVTARHADGSAHVAARRFTVAR